MNKKALTADILLLITAIIWGSAFVAQKTGMEYVGPFTYNGVRFLLGSVSLLPLIFILDARKRRKRTWANLDFHADANATAAGAGGVKKLVFSSVLAGLCLFTAIAFQQMGMIYTTVGNSGFITGVYVVLVPIAGAFFGRKTRLPTWIGAALAFAGLFVVSIVADMGNLTPQSFLRELGTVFSTFNKGDILIFVCSIFWACHVLVIDSLVKNVSALKLSCGQFVVAGILCLLAAAVDLAGRTGAAADALALALSDPVGHKALGPEMFHAGFSWANITAGAVPILYGGIISAGVAYTLQVVAQKNSPPAHAVIILSLETVFAAAAGVILIGETLGSVRLAGFALMFAGMMATQWDLIARAPK
jgi:drug/metabolite transporter (DMT)-like permease